MQLNYHHLQYFWAVAREGSIAGASRRLHVGAPAISTQLKQLETALGAALFVRRGRGMELTDAGRTALHYADEIFAQGEELLGALQGQGARRPLSFRVGVADVMPKILAQRLLEPALELDPPMRLVCREGHPDELLADLAVHRLDMVLSDGPIPANVDVRAYNHLLGESSVSLFAAPAVARKLRRGFPSSLDGVALLLPGPRTALRRTLDQWFRDRDVHPQVVGEFDDGALMKAFGQRGAGVFPALTAVESDVRAQFGVHLVGRIDEAVERIYAISGERRIQHPAVEALWRHAREHVLEPAAG